MMRATRFRIAVATAITLATLLVIGVSPASAANQHSPSQAGYQGSALSPFTKASARITVPTVTCPASGFYSGSIQVQWSAFGGGTSAIATLSVNVNCNNGALTLHGGIGEIDPTGNAFRTLNVSVGDILQGSLAYTPVSGLLKVSGKNITTGQSTSETVTQKNLSWSGGAYSLFRAGGLGPTSSAGTPVTPELFEFTPIAFSSLTIDGAAAMGKLNGNLTGYDMYNNADTHKLATASAFNAAGNAFKVRFVAAS
jgi:hypothetical protein